jgi:hypothetical protein
MTPGTLPPARIKDAPTTIQIVEPLYPHVKGRSKKNFAPIHARLSMPFPRTAVNPGFTLSIHYIENKLNP